MFSLKLMPESIGRVNESGQENLARPSIVEIRSSFGFQGRQTGQRENLPGPDSEQSEDGQARGSDGMKNRIGQIFGQSDAQKAVEIKA
jgi:hypothetical protein